MASSSKDESISIPAIDDGNAKPYIWAYMVTVCLKFLGCRDEEITWVLGRYDLDYKTFQRSITEHIKDHGVLDELRRVDQLHRSDSSQDGRLQSFNYSWVELAKSLGVPAAEMHSDLDYLNNHPVNIGFYCSELLNLASVRECEVWSQTDGGPMKFAIVSFHNSGWVECRVLAGYYH